MQFNRMERLRLVPGSGTAGRLATIGAVTVLLAATCAAPAQDWPTRPMTLVVPLAAGGSSDGTPAFPLPSCPSLISRPSTNSRSARHCRKDYLRSVGDCCWGALAAWSGPRAAVRASKARQHPINGDYSFRVHILRPAI